MYRRLASVVCVLGLLCTLWVAVRHQHGLASAGSDVEQTACAVCAGGIAPAPRPVLQPLARIVLALELAAQPESAPRRLLLPLAHSGNAPPARG